MFAQVVIDTKSRVLDRVFTYRTDETISVGTRVLVPFGRSNKPSIAVVLNTCDEVDIDEAKIKSIIKVLDEKAIIDEKMIELALWLRNRYISTYNDALRLVFPPGGIKELELFYYPHDDVLDLEKGKAYTKDELLKIITASDFTRLIKDNIISEKYKIKQKVKEHYEKYISLVTYDEGASEKQRAVLDYLRDNDGSALEKNIITSLNISSSPIKTLLKKGLVREDFIQESRKRAYNVNSYEKIKLNKEQEKVYKRMEHSLEHDLGEKFLLRGVTGSGKTEIYLHLVEKCLQMGKDAIVLVPEISLTPQTIRRFIGRFQRKVHVLHSKLSLSERFDEYNDIKSTSPSIVIGARSAIFAPCRNLGLIIIDEEHDQSYISDMNPKYQTDEVAYYRSMSEGATLLLASATPSISSYYNAKHGIYELLELDKKAKGQKEADIELVNMIDEIQRGNISQISSRFFEVIDENLKAKKQSIVFLNRRGYNKEIFCKSCGYTFTCDNCDVSMTYHKGINKLKCHYCGLVKNIPKTCPRCGAEALSFAGYGIEKVEELLRKTFPEAKILRADSDTIKTEDDYINLYKKMNSGAVDILIGTQMISKGLDFKNVDAAIIVSIDANLNFPSYSASEDTYNLITQVAGRAGRDEKGRVLLQSYAIDNETISYAMKGNYEAFYRNEIALRQEFLYPPFINMIYIVGTSLDKNIVQAEMEYLRSDIESYLNKNDIRCNVSKLMQCAIEKINASYRYQIILKYTNTYSKEIKDYIRFILYRSKFAKNKKVNYNIYINPRNFL